MTLTSNSVILVSKASVLVHQYLQLLFIYISIKHRNMTRENEINTSWEKGNGQKPDPEPTVAAVSPCTQIDKSYESQSDSNNSLY